MCYALCHIIFGIFLLFCSYYSYQNFLYWFSIIDSLVFYDIIISVLKWSPLWRLSPLTDWYLIVFHKYVSKNTFSLDEFDGYDSDEMITVDPVCYAVLAAYYSLLNLPLKCRKALRLADRYGVILYCMIDAPSFPFFPSLSPLSSLLPSLLHTVFVISYLIHF